ncbi:MAG: 30S ribosomal protein THX [Steroidobacteraceae bacterium]
MARHRRVSYTCAPAIRGSTSTGVDEMGKGDRRSRRGKIYAGSFGKSRPKDPARAKKQAAKKK